MDPQRYALLKSQQLNPAIRQPGAARTSNDPVYVQPNPVSWIAAGISAQDPRAFVNPNVPIDAYINKSLGLSETVSGNMHVSHWHDTMISPNKFEHQIVWAPPTPHHKHPRERPTLNRHPKYEQRPISGQMHAEDFYRHI